MRFGGVGGAGGALGGGCGSVGEVRRGRPVARLLLGVVVRLFGLFGFGDDSLGFRSGHTLALHDKPVVPPLALGGFFFSGSAHIEAMFDLLRSA